MINFPLKNALRQATASHIARRARCLFVLSTGRVGTTTLAHLLNASPKIKAEHEPFPLYLQETYQIWRGEHPSPAHFAKQFACSRVRVLCRNLFKHRIYAECSNRLTYCADELASFFPNAQFIFLHRQPSQVVRSMMRRKYYSKKPDDAASDWGKYRVRPREGTADSERWADWSPFQKCCWNWHAINSHSLDFATRHPSRTFTLAAPDLFGPNFATLTKMWQWLEIEPPPENVVRPLLAAPTNAQLHGKFPSFGDWDERQREQFDAIAGDTAKALGYTVEQ